jgi:hypothetical protein
MNKKTKEHSSEYLIKSDRHILFLRTHNEIGKYGCLNDTKHAEY